jgi:acyl-CoA reductase-like NAD-dependent aldehyde dehydrogenase
MQPVNPSYLKTIHFDPLMEFHISNFINGENKRPEKTIPITNPATGKLIGSLPDSNEQDVILAVDSALVAFKSWSKTTRLYRSHIMMNIANLIESRLDEFAMAESCDQGKPLSLARSVDIPRAIHNFRFFASAILHQTEKASELDGIAYSYVVKEPVGVAALISPWNLPLYLLTWKIAPCIASGCTAVCKPSEFTSITAFLLCDVMKKAGLPDGVVNMVFGTGLNAGSPLINHPQVPLLSFTGGTATGKLVYQAASLQNKKLSLELGGKNANIIFADCDFEDMLTNTMRSSFANQGEICLCGSRIFVQDSIFEKFIDAFKKRANDLIVGDPLDSKTSMGALVSKQHMEKVLSYIQIAKDEGGKIIFGGKRLTTPGLEHGYFLSPTIITNLHATESRCQKEEIFGPVVTVTPFESEEQVLEFANATEYGLSASVWTQNIKRANQIARGIRTGTVWINTWMTRDLNMPFGGMKFSGLGREGVDESFHFFCEEKTICCKF